MNIKRIMTVLVILCSLVLVVNAPLVFAGNSSQKPNEKWLDFDEANNGESYTWEGEPSRIDLASQDEWQWNIPNITFGQMSDEEHEEESDYQNYEDEKEDSDEDSDSEEGKDEEENSNDKFDIDLSSENEVPEVNSEGEGWANVRLLEDQSLVCVDMEISGIELPATDAHIHKAASGESGPVVLALPIPNEEGDAYGCVKATSDQLAEIMKSPELFYVNVHSEEYPNGAVRGQLSD